MNFKFENIRKGPVSTAIGAALVLISFYLMLWTETSTGEALMVLGVGAAFMGLRSNRIDGPGAGKTVTMVIGLGFTIFYSSSCATFDRCAKKYGTGETHTVRDTVRIKEPVPVPGDSVLTRLQLDSLLAAKPGDTVVIESHEGKAQVKFWKDKYNNYLNAQVNCNEDTVWLEKEVPVEVDCPDTVILDPAKKDLTWWEKQWEGFKEIAAWCMITLLVMLGVRFIFK